ncbi:Annexin [Wilcoxina mikolae CBS 423.85]|nr:Annexin [Wilcoxina mikolae CBS 423.85]
MSSRNIQTYIDLWEEASPDHNSDPPPPVPPKIPLSKDILPPPLGIPEKNPLRLQKRDANKKAEGKTYNVKDESFMVMKVAEDQSTTPPMLRQISTSFESWTPPHQHTEESKISLGTTEAPDSPPESPPDSPDYAATFRSIAMGNPFDTPSLKRAVSSASRAESPSDSLPFTPDELWNFHRPPSAPTRRITTRRSRHASMTQQPGRELHEQGNQSDSNDWSCSTTNTVVQSKPASMHGSEEYETPPMVNRLALPSDFTYEQLEPYTYSVPIPQSYTSDIPVPDSPTATIGSGSSQSFTSGGSKTSSILSIDGNPISSKAAKMLGIDPSTTRILSYSPNRSSQVITDIPDRYNFHRSQTASSPDTRSISLPEVVTSQDRKPSIPIIPYDATLDATRVWKSLKKTKKPDTDLLSETLVGVSHQPSKLAVLKQKYREIYGDDLVSDIRAGTSGLYRTALTRLLAGPREAEAQALNKNDSTYFLDEKLMAEALFGKDPEDIKHIKLHFEQLHGLSLKTVLKNLYLFSPVSAGLVFSSASPSGSFGQACLRVLKANRDVESVETLAMMDTDKLIERERRMARDVEELYQIHDCVKRLNLNLLLELVLQRSDLYLAELSRRFYERYGKELAELVAAKDKSTMVPGSYYPFSLGYAVTFTLTGATNKPQRDAKLLEDCMKGIGTKDARLMARIIRIHFDPDPLHVDFVREVYQQRYGRQLADRVKDNTKGAYRDLLLKILEGKGGVTGESFV